MAPTPLTAPFRLTLQYTVGALVHKAHYYLNCVASADPMLFDTVPRPGFANIGVSNLDSVIFNYIKAFYDPAGTTFDSSTLEKLVGGAWVFQSAKAATVVPTGAGAFSPAAMVTFSGKDAVNRNLPVYFYEQFFGGFAKFASYAALSAANKAIANGFFNAGGTAVAQEPWAWRMARGTAFSNRWLALVADSNEKLRRIRGIK